MFDLNNEIGNTNYIFGFNLKNGISPSSNIVKDIYDQEPKSASQFISEKPNIKKSFSENPQRN